MYETNERQRTSMNKYLKLYETQSKSMKIYNNE